MTKDERTEWLYRIGIDLNLKSLIAEVREVESALGGFADKLEQIEKKYEKDNGEVSKEDVHSWCKANNAVLVERDTFNDLIRRL